MFKNHLKIAWRSLKRQPFFTFLNTFGLAIGMAGGLLISLYIYDELSYDTMFADADRIYRINADIKFGGAEQRSAEVSEPMAAAMQADFSQIELTSRIRNWGSLLVRKANTTANTKELNSAYADSTFFKMFGIELLFGNPDGALKEPNTLVMTRTAAEKHFGIANALGQQLLIDNTETYTVSGVIEDLPRNSMIRDHSIFMAMSGYDDPGKQEWGSHNYFTFIKLIPSANIADIQTQLQGMVGKYVIPWVQNVYPGMTEEAFEASGNYLRYNTIALTDIHLKSARDTELSANSSTQNVYILSFIGLFLIVLAAVNFMNLSTAHSLKRSKEVGIRKTLGSARSELVRQFMTESLLISFISLLIALGVASLALPFFNELAGTALSIPFGSINFWVTLLLATIILALFSGSYPSFFMSRFMPIAVLKGSGESGAGGAGIRNSLVVFQFAISVFLIISTLVVFQQLNFIQSKDLGFTKDQVLIIEDVFTAGDGLPAFKEQVEQLAYVSNVSQSSYLPTPSWRTNSSFFQEGAEEQENALNMQTWGVDHNYLNTLDMELLAGRDFDRKMATDSTAMLLNETAVAIMGLSPEAVLGKKVSRELGEDNPLFYTVIGVVKNFHFASLRENIGALSLYLGDNSNTLAVKIKSGNFSNVIADIETLWERVAPGQPFNYAFMSDSFNATYQAEQRLGKIFMSFTILSILIACLGLFGLAAFNAEKRTKEIGIRKVLGASIGQISIRLTSDFLKLVGLAIIISVPLGWYAMHKWLEDFSYRIDIGWELLVLAAVLAVAIAVITVSYQSIKAAIVNPVKSLRTE